MSDPSSSVRYESTPRDAILFLPGLSIGLTEGKTVAGVVTRLASAVEEECQTGEALFTVEFREDVDASAPKGTPRLRRIATVMRKDSHGQRPAFDVLDYEWASSIANAWQSQPAVTRAIRGILTLLSVNRFIQFFRKGANKSPFGRMQLVLIFLIVLAAAAYVGVLVVAGVQAFFQIPYVWGVSRPAAGQSSAAGNEITHAQWLAIVATLLLPFLRKARERLSKIGAGIFSVNSFVRTGDHRDESIGRLVKGAEEEFRNKALYPRVKVVGYSFGAVLALDVLLPRGDDPEKAFDTVDTLITIGVPYEMVEAIDADYWKGRHGRPGGDLTWVNIYERIDLLGSSFTPAGKANEDSGLANAQDDKNPFLPHMNSVHI